MCWQDEKHRPNPALFLVTQDLQCSGGDTLSLYEPHGKTSLLQATTVLHQNITKEAADGNVVVDTENIESLSSYTPLTDDVN